MDEIKPGLVGLIIVLSAVFAGRGRVNTTIIAGPTATMTVVEGSTVVFGCSTTSVEVEWAFEPNNYIETVVIYPVHGGVKPIYQDRVRVVKSASGFENQFKLIIERVAMSDAGRHICRNPHSQNGATREMYLTVQETSNQANPTEAAGEVQSSSLSFLLRTSGSFLVILGNITLVFAWCKRKQDQQSNRSEVLGRISFALGAISVIFGISGIICMWCKRRQNRRNAALAQASTQEDQILPDIEHNGEVATDSVRLNDIETSKS